MTRLLLALASALTALALALLVFPTAFRPDDPPPIEVVPALFGDAETAVRRAAMEAEHPPVPIRAFPDTTLLREVTARPLLQRLYPQLRTGAMIWHPQRGFRRRADQVNRFRWPEHSGGDWTLATNSEGWRHETELVPGRPLLAVAGDSHTEGACDLDGTFTGRLAAELAGPDLDVLNAACGGHSFHQYLGVLEDLCGDVPGELVDPAREVDLRTLVVAVYGGNDFVEVLKLAHWLHRTERPLGWGRDNARLGPWRKTHMPALAQAVDSALYFRNNPSEAELALTEGLAVSEELLRHAERRGIRLLFLYLPSALEVEPERHPEHFDALLADLELTDDELVAVHGLGDRFLTGLEQLGAESLDLRPLLAASPVATYWSRDLHLNLDGHALVAEALLDWYRGTEDR